MKREAFRHAGMRPKWARVVCLLLGSLVLIFAFCKGVAYVSNQRDYITSDTGDIVHGLRSARGPALTSALVSAAMKYESVSQEELDAVVIALFSSRLKTVDDEDTAFLIMTRHQAMARNSVCQYIQQQSDNKIAKYSPTIILRLRRSIGLLWGIEWDETKGVSALRSKLMDVCP